MSLTDLKESLAELSQLLDGIEGDEQRVRKEALSQLAAEIDPLSQRDATIFSVLGVHNKEYVVSNFLAWLMRPRESHGLGDWFLANFFQLLTVRSDTSFDAKLQPEAVEVIREERSGEAIPDVIVVDHGSHMVCVVENKLFAEEGEDQTNRIARDAKRNFETFASSSSLQRPLLVFLTPRGHLEPECSEFVHLFWEDVIEVLRSAPAGGLSNLLISHFVKNMEVTVLVKPFEEFSERAKLYFKYRKEIAEVASAWSEELARLFARVSDKLESSDWFKAGKYKVELAGTQLTVYRPQWSALPDRSKGIGIWLSVSEGEYPQELELSLYHDNPSTRPSFNKKFFARISSLRNRPGANEGWRYGREIETSASIAWKSIPLLVDDGERLIATLFNELEEAAKLFGSSIDECI